MAKCVYTYKIIDSGFKLLLMYLVTVPRTGRRRDNKAEQRDANIKIELLCIQIGEKEERRAAADIPLSVLN